MALDTWMEVWVGMEALITKNQVGDANGVDLGMDIVVWSMNPIRGYSSSPTTKRLAQSNFSRQERDPTYFYFFLSRHGSADNKVSGRGCQWWWFKNGYCRFIYESNSRLQFFSDDQAVRTVEFFTIRAWSYVFFFCLTMSGSKFIPETVEGMV